MAPVALTRFAAAAVLVAVASPPGPADGPPADPPPVGMADVVELARKGVGDAVVVDLIRQSGARFRLAPADVVRLKDAHVSDRVIGEMILTAGPAAPPAARPVVVGVGVGGPQPVGWRAAGPDLVRVAHDHPAGPLAGLLRSARLSVRLTGADLPWLKDLGLADKVAVELTVGQGEPAVQVKPGAWGRKPAAEPGSAPAAKAPRPAAPVGTWVREVDGARVALKVTDKRLYATLTTTPPGDGKPGRRTVRADADYAVGPDGVVFGVVTGAEADPPDREAAALDGAPFAFRFRLDDGALTVRGLRGADAAGPRWAAAAVGRYTPAGGNGPGKPASHPDAP